MKLRLIRQSQKYPYGFEHGVGLWPYLVDVIVEREYDCSMGASIDAVREFV